MDHRFENEIRYWINHFTLDDKMGFTIHDRNRENEIVETIYVSKIIEIETISEEDWDNLREFHQRCMLLNREASDFKLYDILLQDFIKTT